MRDGWLTTEQGTAVRKISEVEGAASRLLYMVSVHHDDWRAFAIQMREGLFVVFLRVCTTRADCESTAERLRRHAQQAADLVRRCVALTERLRRSLPPSEPDGIESFGEFLRKVLMLVCRAVDADSG
jgi:hypothetical protein